MPRQHIEYALSAMNRSVAQAARILGVKGAQVKRWAWLFKDSLSGSANPPKGRPRFFTDIDVLALIYVALYWYEPPEMESIRLGLERDEHLDDRCRDILYLHTPILQEPPEDLDDTWRHGVFLNGGGVNEHLELARSYRQTADTLLELALQSGEPRDSCYPVLFAYRHALELYLKILGAMPDFTHSLESCVRLIEKRHGRRIGSPAREWIIELDKIDPRGTAFRYADDEAETLRHAEFWVDYLQLRYAMKRVFEALDHDCLDLLRRCAFC